jgi:hypothetical protein
MHLQPVARRALLAAYHSPGHALHRTRGGYTAMPREIRTSGTAQVEVFTRRAVNWLDNAGLVNFDDPDFPSRIELNTRGQATAEQLLSNTEST